MTTPRDGDKLRDLLQSAAYILSAASQGRSVEIAAGDLYRKVEAALSQPPAPGGREEYDVHAYSDPADIDKHPLRYDPTRDLIESILFKRALDKKLDGYTLRTSLEIAIALATVSPQDGGGK